MSLRDDFEAGPPAVRTRAGVCRLLSPEQKARGLVGGAPHLTLRFRKINPPPKGRALPALVAQANYFARDGLVEVEDNEGRRFLGKELAGEVVKAWGTEYDKGCRRESPGLAVMALYPGKVSEEALLGAVRDWAKAHFPHTPWLIALHDDGGWPHAHVLLRGRSLKTGKMFYPVLNERQALREDLAARLLERGIPVNAVRRETCGLFPIGHARGALFRQATQGDDITLSARYWDDPRYRELARKRYEKRCAVRRGVLERAQRFIGELEREGSEEKRTLAKGLRAYFDALPPVLTREEMMIGRILAGQRRLAEQEAARRALGKEAGDRSREGRSR